MVLINPLPGLQNDVRPALLAGRTHIFLAHPLRASYKDKNTSSTPHREIMPCILRAFFGSMWPFISLGGTQTRPAERHGHVGLKSLAQTERPTQR